jgi:hypothetical protein
MKKQCSMIPLKVKHFKIMISNDSEMDGISDKEFRVMIVRMFNKIKENTNK